MKPGGYKGPERRSYMRLDVNYAVSYIKLSDDLRPIGNMVEDAHSKDISGAGVKFVTPEDISVGSLLEAHIKIPGTGKFITTIGKVVRCEPENKKLFKIALAFAWITKKDKEIIDEYVKKIKLNMLRSETKM